MFGHHWQPAEGTLVDIRVSRSGSGAKALIVEHFLMDVRPSSGEPFRTEVREPLMSSSFVAPSVPDDVVKLKCDPARKKARFDVGDESADKEAAVQAEADRYAAELDAEVGTAAAGTEGEAAR